VGEGANIEKIPRGKVGSAVLWNRMWDIDGKGALGKEERRRPGGE